MEIKENTIYNCDCMELMQEMVSQGIKADWCITDPPYGIGVDGNIGGAGACENTEYSQKDWDKERVSKEYLDFIFKVSKNQIIFGANYYTDYLKPTKSWLTWDKRLNDEDRNNFADCEYMWCSIGQARIFRYQYKGMIQGNMKCKDERFHPTQKPVELWCQLLNYYTKEGDLIFDPFAGSCSLAIACHKLKRRYICCEREKEYYDKGVAWLNQVKSQISMFD